MHCLDINPIIPGFSPDPSVVLVDGDFFLVTSTFHMFPGLPIYTSKDLISWKQIGNAIHRQNQLSLKLSATRLSPADGNGDKMLATGGLYAPTIRYQSGIFYIICTNVIHENGDNTRFENFIVSTANIRSGEWSNPVAFEFNGIDPSIFFDDDGKVYIQGSLSPGPMTKIDMFQIDLKTGKRLSDVREIWDGTGGIYPEGPHIYKKDGFYYLMISEGGTHEDHMITVARSESVWGPYEAFKHNPILSARGTDEYIQYTGHCDMFQDQNNRWWAVCLGVRKDQGRFIMGRETFLTTGSWPDGDWPALDLVKRNPVLDSKELVRPQEAGLTSIPRVDYLYIRDANLNHHKISEDGQSFTLTAGRGDFSQCEKPVTFIGKRQRLLTGNASVKMQRPSSTTETELNAGFAYYKDDQRYIKLFIDFSTSEIVLQIVNNAKSISKTFRREFQLKDDVFLRIHYTERFLKFSYGNGADWISFEALDTIEMTGPDFVGPVIGIFALADTDDVEVKFDRLSVD